MDVVGHLFSLIHTPDGNSLAACVKTLRRPRHLYLLLLKPSGVDALPVVDMGEPLGLLKVFVVQGKKLAIRDFKTSDPYVIVKLGSQTAKTKVINSNLNPVWNEELTFSVTEPVEDLKLEVFDKDRFKADDKMGHAHVNLQPLVSAARLRQILGVATKDGSTLRKVIPDLDNCLAIDSSIDWVNGEVVQDVWLRLCEVESGEIELKIKFTHPPKVV